MKNPVMIKGNKYGIVLVLDQSMDFNELLTMIGEKFKESGKFFDTENQIAISFEGRELSNEEQAEVLQMIGEMCPLRISYIIDTSAATVNHFREALETQAAEEEDSNQQIEAAVMDAVHTTDGRFYKGTLRSGQAIDADSSIVVIGDVNPGASVAARGNIIVLGCLKGTAYAGSDGNNKAFVAALDMIPMQIRIGNVIARAPDKAKPKKGFFKRNSSADMEAKIAFVEDENIYIESINRTVLNDIHFGY